MKILLLGEYSGLHLNLKDGLTELGHDVTIASGGDSWKKIDTDIRFSKSTNAILNKIELLTMPWLKIQKLKGYDVAQLINFYTVPRFSLVNKIFARHIIRNNGATFMLAAGDDPMFVKHSETVLRYSPIPSHEKIDRKAVYYMRRQNHYLDFCEIAQEVNAIIPIMYEYQRCMLEAGFKNLADAIPLPINTQKIQFQENKIRSKIVFYHGVTRPGFKGSHIVKEAFDIAGSKYKNDAEFIYAEKLPLQEYLEAIKRTNVIVDQLFSHSLAMNAIYSMAQGKIVIGGNEPESGMIYNLERGDLNPSFNAEPSVQSLLLTIDSIISQKDKIPSLGEASRKFVENHHSHVKIAKSYLETWGKYQS